MLSLREKMPWNYHVMLLGITCNGPGSTMAQQLRRVVSSRLVPMEPYTEVTLRVHRVEITSVLSGTPLLESWHSAGRYRLLLQVRSHFSIIGTRIWTDLNNKKENNEAQGCAFNAELEKKKWIPACSLGKQPSHLACPRPFLVWSVIMILLEDDLAETFSQVSFKSYLPSKNISFPLRTTGFDFF